MYAQSHISYSSMGDSFENMEKEEIAFHLTFSPCLTIFCAVYLKTYYLTIYQTNEISGPFPKRQFQFLDSTKLKEFADDNFEFDES